MAGKTRFVTWNGKDLPWEFRHLPAGRYVVEAVADQAPAFSATRARKAGCSAKRQHLGRRPRSHVVASALAAR